MTRFSPVSLPDEVLDVFWPFALSSDLPMSCLLKKEEKKLKIK